ncbi:FAD-dependent oxidoreductase [Roseibium marinum]|uniref:2-polyprenyl-6-methoxyphenol hydroxylase-like FAD-dependent oxidoreductase n=1 Tax=Roseibium marinum TaxID=281252 RepID=A0A2S3UKD9_9HYPH|nr:NAD(P)/FAD-dependent oxidoreductase [Roseibium marinum]POF28145.1 2-polyprenyl-6-methoxyphenol hydroxylase-like FAD-dependent oxidoreductase [Roseibium marinum]
MKIAIAGAGIGGLAVAILIERLGHEISVFEQFHEPAPVGSGLMIQPVGLEVLRLAGAAEAVQAHATPIARVLGHSAMTGRRVLDVSYGRTPGLGIHRASLFFALYERARGLNLSWHSGRRVSGFDDGRLQFEGGSVSEEFDLVIDASGANSVLSPLKARTLAFGAIWGTVDWVPGVLPDDHLSQRYRRADRMIGVLPVGRMPGDDCRKAAFFWSLRQGGYDDWRRAGLRSWKDEALSLWPEAGPFIDQIGDPDQMTMARYSHGTLKKVWNGRIVFIGDAAHRASPQLGQGANMALLDAAALARALETLPADLALPAYGRARRWHVGVYQAFSAVFTPAYQSDSRWLPALRDHVLFPASRIPPVPALLSRLIAGTLVPSGAI